MIKVKYILYTLPQTKALQGPQIYMQQWQY